MKFNRPYDFSFAAGLVKLNLQHISVFDDGQFPLALHALRDLQEISLHNAIPNLHCISSNGTCQVPALTVPDGAEILQISLPRCSHFGKVASPIITH